MIRIRLLSDNGAGRRHGEVLNGEGTVIGSAQDYTYDGRGYAVHTVPFAGFVAEHEVEYVPQPLEGQG
jgi:hypothetical protein